jgi:hypothetical protein
MQESSIKQSYYFCISGTDFVEKSMKKCQQMLYRKNTRSVADTEITAVLEMIAL